MCYNFDYNNLEITMRKLKFGFTIAEIATSMTIIGVVAALLMPQVVKNLQKNQAGPILGRAVEQIVLGNQNLIQMANISTNSVTQFDVLGGIRERDLNPASQTNNFILSILPEIIPAFWNLENETIDADEILEIRSFTPNADEENNAIPLSYRFSKISAGVAIDNNNINATPNGNDEDTGMIIYIDTTGWDKAPNIYGRDIFAFHLINNGTLRPFNENDADNGLELTQQVVKDGFRVTYN